MPLVNPVPTPAKEPVKFNFMDYRLLLSIPALIVCLFLIAGFGSDFIPSGSMEPTLLPGDHIIIVKNWLAYPFGAKPSRGDIIVFHHVSDEPASDEVEPKSDVLIKRVVGLPGETILILGSGIYINGRLLKEKYSVYPDDPRLSNNFHYAVGEPYQIPADSYFMMGDNRKVSDDSRYWGALKREDILGRFARVLYHKDIDKATEKGH